MSAPGRTILEEMEGDEFRGGTPLFRNAYHGFAVELWAITDELQRVSYLVVKNFGSQPIGCFQKKEDAITVYDAAERVMLKRGDRKKIEMESHSNNPLFGSFG